MTDFTKINLTDINQMTARKSKWTGFKKNTSSVKITKWIAIKCAQCRKTFDCITDGKLSAKRYNRFLPLPNCKHHGG